MRRFVKVLLSMVLVLVLVAGASLAYLFLRYPAVGEPPRLEVAGTAEQVARGAYLANHVTVCLDCHSAHDTSRFSNPPRQDAMGHGGDVFGHAQGFPGEVHMANLTPTGVRNAVEKWPEATAAVPVAAR